jgi:hypothetical protein
MQITITERRNTPSRLKIIVDEVNLSISGRMGEPFTVTLSGILCREDGEIYIPNEKPLREIKNSHKKRKG